MPGDARFHALLKEMGELHDRKQLDYGADHDAFANVRAAEEFGIAGWVGALSRLNDKVIRLKQFARRGSLANESAEDSMLDIAVYALIALILYREQSEGRGEVVEKTDYSRGVTKFSGYSMTMPVSMLEEITDFPHAKVDTYLGELAERGRKNPNAEPDCETGEYPPDLEKLTSFGEEGSFSGRDAER